MALLNLTAASRAAGVNRSTVVRALKSGRLSATTNDAGERCIDTAELLRVFGPLEADARALPTHALGNATLVEVLREQLRLAHEREHQARQEKTRLLALLEAEQEARRALEQKLLPPPPPAPPLARHARLWILLAMLAMAVAALVISRDAVGCHISLGGAARPVASATQTYWCIYPLVAEYFLVNPAVAQPLAAVFFPSLFAMGQAD